MSSHNTVVLNGDKRLIQAKLARLSLDMVMNRKTSYYGRLHFENLSISRGNRNRLVDVKRYCFYVRMETVWMPFINKVRECKRVWIGLGEVKTVRLDMCRVV